MLHAVWRKVRLKPYTNHHIERMTARLEFSLSLINNEARLERVLDVGCSGGWLEQTLHLGEMHAHVVGIEPDEATVALARSSFPQGDFRVASVLSLPFEDASFDGAVMLEVLEHIPPGCEVQALAEVRRVVKSGGWIVFSTPADHLAGKLLDPAWYFGHRHYSKRTLATLFKGAGFAIEEMLVRGAWFEIFGTISLYVFKWLFRSEDPFKARFERGRRKEFFSSTSGMTNVFVRARAV